ncbi:hypothetical protein MW887_005652 [Aspergillus wentii]|nr:hypothetical protein MW887_005652 [Aspergillus wentii]
MLSNFPPELLLLISQYIDQTDINSLTQANRSLHTTLNSYLYKHNIHHRGGEGLIWTAHYGHKRPLEIFLQHGADPNIQIVEMDMVCYIPVHLYRSEYDNKEYVVVCNPNFTIWKALKRSLRPSWLGSTIKPGLLDQTPLLTALKNDHVDIAETLLARDGVNINSQNMIYETALHIAVSKYMESIVTKLLARDDIKLQAKDVMGHTAFDVALTKGYAGIVELFLSYTAVPFHSSCGMRSPLTFAITHGDVSTARALLGYTHVHRETPYLVRVPGMGNPEMGEVLLNGVKRGTLRLLGVENELKHAARGGDETAMKIILAHDTIDPDTRCDRGATALAIAAEHGHVKIMEMLLDTGKVDVNKPDDKGNTPLFYAAQSGRPAVELLLAEDGIKYALNKKGQSPADRAFKSGHKDLSKFLKRVKIARELERLR